MFKFNAITAVIKQISKRAKSNSPLIGLIVAGLGFTGSIVSTATATIKAVKNTEQVEEETGEKLTKKELLKENWKYYIAPGLLWVGSAASLCFAAKGYDKSIKSLASLYAASQTAKNQLEEHVRSVLGDEKYEEVQEEIAQKELDNNPVTNATILDTGHGSYLCYDQMSGRYFRSSEDWIRRAVNIFNNEICTRKCGLSYNDLFDTISPNFDAIEFGEDVGWGPDRGVADIRITTKKASTGEPCLVMRYNRKPYQQFDWCG